MCGVFGPLPAELLLNILDQLVNTRNGHRPVARPQSDSVTKTLRSLTLVSRTVYPIATEYLYSNCVWLESLVALQRFSTTLKQNRQRHTLANGTTVQKNRGFAKFDLSRHVTSVYMTPVEPGLFDLNQCEPSAGLPAIADLCQNIGSTLKRLYLDSLPAFSLFMCTNNRILDAVNHNLFSRMLHLEELVISHDVIWHLPQCLPPNLKRLAVVAGFSADVESIFYLSSSTLETLVLFRPPDLTADDIESFFSSYHGKSLDVVLFEKNCNHSTPEGTREWKPDDAVRIWEADVPVSYYGHDDPTELCDEWMWNQGIAGTLWSQTRRRMLSWAEIQRRLAGPIHSIVDTPTSDA